MIASMPAHDDADQAAIIIMLLNDQDAASILSRLQPEELERLGNRMCALGDVDVTSMSSAIHGFIRHAENPDLPSTERHAHLTRVMTRAVGEVKAQNMMQRIAPQAQSRTIEIARWLAPQTLAPLLVDEHPQAIAVLLLMLDPEPAAQMLANLPADKQAGVVERIARLGPVSGHAVAMLSELLERRLAERFGQAALTMGGIREAAEIINKAARSVEQVVMPAISRKDRLLADAIEAEMFKFEQILALDAQAMGRLLREVENEVLVDALKGIGEDEHGAFFAAMSTRAADGVRDEMELRGRIKKADVEAAQQRMIQHARTLAEQGEIVFGSGDGDYV
ncbi:flagellar motor switch protein FliG [Croceicoccus sp. F390]|uniref:Flagellar motor switch protein FliG n=1 Tax=Croceicoccus esteveae TaxID=3075597 RepID=A0ABU2ZDL3_9SPHN|nr:flagellar motor switch protein FliG [Croceicoccus sp. F390]MDT0574690.1 flagellar motor switch protein FliG [Croceicoccus sp. F390]